MTHSKCGLLLLLAIAGVAACGGDPTSSFRQGNERIVATPTSLFLQQGANVFVIAELQDAQGNQLTEDLQTRNVGSQITVERDTAFLETTNGTKLKTRERFIVTAVAPGSSSFTLTSGADTLLVPVRVVPTAITATFSNATPAANEEVTVTLPAGYKFGPDAAVLSPDGSTGFIRSFSADSNSISVLLAPGSGPLTLSGFGADFLPGVALTNLQTDASITVAPVVPLSGTGATGTAPVFAVAPIGGSTVLFDGGTFDYVAPLVFPGVPGVFPTPARLYKFTVPAGVGPLDVTLDWTSSEDLGVYYFQSNGTTLTGSPADAGGGGAHPETSSSTFAPGTYFMAVVNFSATNPTYFSVQLATEPVPAP